MDPLCFRASDPSLGWCPWFLGTLNLFPFPEAGFGRPQLEQSPARLHRAELGCQKTCVGTKSFCPPHTAKLAEFLGPAGTSSRLLQTPTWPSSCLVLPTLQKKLKHNKKPKPTDLLRLLRSNPQGYRDEYSASSIFPEPGGMKSRAVSS